MNQAVPTKIKVRDFAIGFFGWFLSGNLIVAIGLLLYPIIMGVFGIFVLLTIVMIFYSFSQKRNWIGIGIVTAIITNGVIMASLNLLMWFTPFLPFPIGLFLLMS